MKPELGYVILAAGKGTRMHSDSPKVLQQVLGKPLLGYVYDALTHVSAAQIWTVVGFQAAKVEDCFPGQKGQFVLQEQQLGTGHAVMLAWERVAASGISHLCVLNGDTPHVPVDAIADLVELCVVQNAGMGMLTLRLENPFGYGRVIRNAEGYVERVVEEKDFCAADHGGEVFEVNSGVYVFDVQRCWPLLEKMDRSNAQQEYYLTQMIAICAAAGLPVAGLPFGSSDLLRGINSPRELVRFEESLRRKIVEGLLDSGVILRNSETIFIGPDVAVAPGAEIMGPCEIYGCSRIERGAFISSHCWIKDSILGPCQVKSFSHIEGSHIRAGASVGPYGRIRPGSDIGEDARVGNFVEVKKSVLHAGAKAGHLSYLGDSDIGPGVNIGAGTITCNYDGAKKHRTEIHENAFIGSNTALVAPVVVGAGALVAAGSVVTKNVPDGALCVARARQSNLDRKKKSLQS
ncbi:MAG: bifunctional UDP-N-acetylglucosamine diphosphorylase/glucosamine-1-phosphate N-acetyltransferase GlmU [Desulfomicrobium apsheronum]|nr:bifunctional UDP-N-acetylglucosamine diphosphorylase/glucosamine-1-phosphate N-acetyltransferase GlmU [Desulfomicrobium apsheronum]